MKIEFGRNIVKITETGSTAILADGTHIEAIPEDTEEYRERARSLGYKSALEMCQEHDFIHVMLADALGMSQSPALTRGANGLPINELAGAEEDAVLAIQKFWNLYRKEIEEDDDIPF